MDIIGYIFIIVFGFALLLPTYKTGRDTKRATRIRVSKLIREINEREAEKN